MAHTRQPLQSSPAACVGPVACAEPAAWDAPFPWEQHAQPEDLANAQASQGNSFATGQLPAATGPANPNRAPVGPFAGGAGLTPEQEAAARTQRQQQASAILQQNQVPVQAGRVYVVQIDQEAPVAQDPAHPAALSADQRRQQGAYMGAYTGQTAVFRANERGELEQVGDVYRSSSHPQGLGGRETSDAERRAGIGSHDGDNTTDYAHMQPGTYQYGGRAYGHNFPLRVGERQANGRWSSSMPMPYDTDHDGTISDAERARPYEVHGANVHPGGAYGPGSAGCQNLHPDDFERFQSTVEGNTSEREGFTYVLARRPNTGDTYRRSPYGDASAQQAPRRPAR